MPFTKPRIPHLNCNHHAPRQRFRVGAIPESQHVVRPWAGEVISLARLGHAWIDGSIEITDRK
jgi:hypothetical protein